MKFRGIFSIAIVGAGIAFSPAVVRAQVPGVVTVAQAAAFTPFPGAVSPKTVTEGDIGKEVTLAGTIGSVRESNSGRAPSVLTLQPGGNVSVVFWPDMNQAILGSLEFPTPGTGISVKGEVSEYRGDLQIRVSDASNIRLEGFPVITGAGPDDSDADAGDAVPGAPSPGEDGYFTAAQAVHPSLQEQNISVKGTVDQFRASWSETAPNVIHLREDGKEMEIVYWPDVAANLDESFSEGMMVHATGEMSEHRGRPQLRVRDAAMISSKPLPESAVKGVPTVVDPEKSVATWSAGAGTVSPAVIEKVSLAPGTLVKANQVDVGHAGSEVVMAGVVKATVPSDDGLKVALDDGTGQIVVTLANGLVAGSQFDHIHKGDELRVQGTLKYNELRNQVELVPASEKDLQFVK